MSRSSALGADPLALRKKGPGRDGEERRAPRLFGVALVTVGLIIVTVIGVQLLRGAVARDRARGEWTKLMATASISSIPALDMTRARSGSPVTRVIIPSIRLDEVVVEGLSDKDLWAGPGHMPGTVFPGENGNSVISAHRDRHFHQLDDVRVGELIETHTPAMSVMWRVKSRRVVKRTDPVIRETAEPTLTLTTCWPTRYIGPAPDRLILTAVPVSIKERGAVAAATATPAPAAPVVTATTTDTTPAKTR